jgi:hypothetical protein
LAADASENNLTSAKTQRLSAVDRARRELLLDAIGEACSDAVDYAQSADRAVFHRDRRALFPAVDGLVVKAIAAGAAAVELRRLLAGQSTGGAP